MAKHTDSTDPLDGIRLTHPDKVLYPQQGITKRELALYLAAVADRMLPHTARRFISLVRCPQGRARRCFFQRHAGAGLPDAFRRLPVEEKEGDTEEYIYIVDRQGLLAAAQFGVLEIHLWGSRGDRVHYPDRLVFDLDPGPGVDFADVKRAAREMRDALDALKLKSFPLLTGGKGIHVIAPMERRRRWPEVKAFARALAERFAEQDPARFVATMTKSRREGRIFIDYLRNDLSASAIAPWSPRAREGAPVAWPVSWKELDRIPASNSVNIRTAAGQAGRPDPWPDYFDLRQPLRAASLRALGVSA